VSNYGESLFVGYRYYEKKEIEPLFPFGHGLSYTAFSYGAVETEKQRYLDDERIDVTIEIKNTGKLAGKEIVQLYVKPDVATSAKGRVRPMKELKAFGKIELAADERGNARMKGGTIMNKYEPVYKRFPLSDSEKTTAADFQKTNGRAIRMPQPILEFAIKRLLSKMRETSLLTTLPEVKIAHEIVKETYTADVGSGSFNIYLYRRADLPEGKYPLFYFIHGGGFLGGTYLSNEGLIRKLADENDFVCVSVEYHLSPEVRYPIALRECEKGLFLLLESPETRRFIDTSKVYVVGDSAGGNLAAVLDLSLKNRHDFTPAGQILLYPVTDMNDLNKESYRRREPEFHSMWKVILFARKMYAQSRADYTDIYFSPLLTAKTDDPHPTRALLLLAERDGLLDDGVLYGAHLRKFGGEVRTVIYEGAYHAFINGLGDSDTAEDAYREIVQFIENQS
jgi:acetyl esterase/lipase